MPISDTRARSAKPRAKVYRIADGGGLCLEVRPSGSKHWRLRYRIDGKEQMFTIGAYPGVGLAKARQWREWAKPHISLGVHPADALAEEQRERRREKVITFRLVSEEWYATNAPNWSERYRDDIRESLDRELLPHLGDLPIRSITAADVLAFLRDVEERRAKTTALKFKVWISGVFRYAVATLRADMDPTALLRGALVPKKRQHAVALEEDELRDFLRRLGEVSCWPGTRLALDFALQTFVRTSELRQAEWTQFDLGGALWRIPPASMKSDRMHLVPLSRQVLALLEELRVYSGQRRYLFPSTTDPRKPMGRTSLNQVIYRMKLPGRFSAHGFRATASTMLNESGWHPDAIELQLAHVVKDRTRGAYNHAQHMETRREMMQAWSDYIDTLRPSRPPATLS